MPSSCAVILSGAKNPRILLVLPLLSAPLPRSLIQQQRPRHRRIQTLNWSRAGNRHSRIAHLHPLCRQSVALIPNHHRTARHKTHTLRCNHASIIRSHRRNQLHAALFQLCNRRCPHAHHRHTKNTPHTRPQRLLVPRAHRPRSRKNSRSPKSLRGPHQRPKIARVLQSHRNQDQRRSLSSPHHIVQLPHRRHHESRHPLRRLRLHHTSKHLLSQPQHLHPTRHDLRRLAPLTHEHGLQDPSTAQRLFQQMVALNRNQASTQSRMALKRRPKLFHTCIRSARNHVRTHRRILPLSSIAQRFTLPPPYPLE
jgi:hypothetical protein